MLHLKFSNPEKLFFTSDLHLSHENIIKYCNRPFSNSDEMNEAIIKNWNEKIPVDGIVFNNGDLGMNVNKYKHLLPRLNGTIYHIVGNHDNEACINHLKSIGIKVADMASVIVKDEEIAGGSQVIILCHYQFSVWDQSHKGSWHLYGHEHSLQHNNTTAKIDVGVDGHNMTPWSYEEIKDQITMQLMKNK